MAISSTKKKPITAFFNKMAKAYTRAAASNDPQPNLDPMQTFTRALSHLSEEEREEEADVEENKEAKHHVEHLRMQASSYPSIGTMPTIGAYSLTSGPLYSHTSHPSTASSSPEKTKEQYPVFASSPSSSTTSASHHRSLWAVEPHSPPLRTLEIPPIQPSDSLKRHISQLASSITASKAAFSLMRASASTRKNADDAYRSAEKSMEEELQRLSDIHIMLYSLTQQQDFGVRQDRADETSSSQSTSPNVKGNGEKQDMILKSYEGVIARFHDEIRKKDAVTEALKETLAKSMLKGEKLQQRIKALEAKLSTEQPK